MDTLPPIEDFADDFDPFNALLTIGGEGHIEEPLEKLAELCKTHPVYEADMQSFFGAPRQVIFEKDTPAFMIIGFDAVNKALAAPDLYSNTIYEMHAGQFFGKSITTMDAPEHTRYRKLFQEGFTPKMLMALRPRFQHVIDQLMANFESSGKADLVGDFARQFPFHFICDLMELPESDRPVFHKIAHGQTSYPFDPKHGKEASDKLGRYLKALIAQRRALKSDSDFVSLLSNIEVDGDHLPEDVLLGFFRQLMNAGGDTSYQSFSNIMALLFQNPDQLDLIRKDRKLIARALEEGLRLAAPISAIDRVTMRDTELEGVAIPKGAIIRVCIGAANRDEKIWKNPNKFDVLRDQFRHVTFGYGAHICVGQFLARMELQMAMDTLLSRLPNVRIDSSMPAPKTRGVTFRGTDAVHVMWDLPIKH